MIRINNTQYFHFLQHADTLRRSGSLCDAIISVKSQTFRAHRLVLACASRRLAQQLAQGETDSPVHCTLEYFSPRTFQQVLDFTYTQALDVSVDDLHLLLKAAQHLEMQPLEDQCRKQLDTLSYRARTEDKIEEMTDVKEERESAEEMDEKEKSSPPQQKKLQETSSPKGEASDSIVMENLSPRDPAKNHNSPPRPRKKLRLSPMQATPCNRDSVIARPVAISSSFSSPWTFTNMLSSVSSLFKPNYSNLIAAHPLQSQSQSSVAYPFPLSSPRMFPILAPHFQNPVHSSIMGYSGIYSRYPQNLYARSTGMESIIKQGLLKRKKASQREFNRTVESSEISYTEVPKANAERVKVCHNCNANLPGDPVQRESTATPSGEKPFECRLCGQRSRDYSAMIKHLRTHGGAAPYQCTVCLEFCNSLVAMQRHIKSHAVQDFPPDWSINSTYLYTSHI
ncbi:Zinc finger and BTB domain-containing protein 16-A [Channa argus]|uniref:Zinc finger and BTB domain-containing protein 16-A n=1 Tax=Channa argus TaxID=215402 RepID=A0A6G1PNI6_CHAAH|nr:Zinc finger and BTB domain-containing protein 16-A [Channa argus]